MKLLEENHSAWRILTCRHEWTKPDEFAVKRCPKCKMAWIDANALRRVLDAK